MGGHIALQLAVEPLAAHLVGDLPPQGVGLERLALGLVDRDLVTGDADHGDLARGVESGGIEDARVQQVADERSDVAPLERQVDEGDQRVGLATPEGRLEPMDRRD